ncbi:hypothetical protein [Acrocarpospora corrugata]|uniref:hypothetical protein n=1 Tax=Acrocarpospora corrugata TaxID=35763 RepID=UPI0012D33271|nr:hypothetical protein [Acrocarpospora corrugata]
MIARGGHRLAGCQPPTSSAAIRRNSAAPAPAGRPPGQPSTVQARYPGTTVRPDPAPGVRRRQVATDIDLRGHLPAGRPELSPGLS